VRAPKPAHIRTGDSDLPEERRDIRLRDVERTPRVNMLIA
jgi:hypothetical protein